jgi:hypothetical protein
MDQELFKQVNELWDYGVLLAVNPEVRNSLYSCNSNLYVIWYTSNNVAYKVEAISQENAQKMFKEFAT